MCRMDGARVLRYLNDPAVSGRSGMGRRPAMDERDEDVCSLPRPLRYLLHPYASDHAELHGAGGGGRLLRTVLRQ